MLPRAQFEQQVADAYQRLYDLVHLRTHPLTDILVPDPSLRRKEKAWQVHHILLDVIDELDPGPQAPAFSREWRRHRLMVLRYVDGLDPQTVADQLAISRRHYYREHEAAIEAIASILWDRYVARPGTAPVGPAAVEDQEAISRLELLRLEAARLNQANRYTWLPEVIQGVVQLVREMAEQKDIRVEVALAPDLPNVGIDRNILRQILLGLLSYLVEHFTQGTILIRGSQVESRLHLSLHGQGVATEHRGAPGDEDEDKVRLSMLNELAAMQEARLHVISETFGIAGFRLELPTAPPRTILVVDDNEDVLQLFQRYLHQHHYQVVTAQSGAEAIHLARQLQPFAITLDLMMPDQDGWDTLQTLANQPQTQHIPIIVCTVLSAKELALSLGAAAFLEKPVTEQALISALAALEKP